MTRYRILRALLICSAALATANCAAVQRHLAWLHTPKAAPRVASRLSTAPSDVVTAALDDGLYGDAVKAIGKRDYGNALELLQAARERTPGDVRVLNAFGVVYDKLGRFDLSGRYYSEAAALDPGSTILANNLAYSRVLQARATAADRYASPTEVRTASVTPAPAPTPVVTAPPATVTVASAAPPMSKPVMPPPLHIWPVERAMLTTVSLKLQSLQVTSPGELFPTPGLRGDLFDRAADTTIEHRATPQPQPLLVAANESVALQTASFDPVITPDTPLATTFEALPAMTHGAAPLPMQVAANETVSLPAVSYNQALAESASPLESILPTPEPVRAPIKRSVAATLASADAQEPQMGRVVSDGPGRVKLVPAPRAASALAYAPTSVMTLGGPALRTAAQGPAVMASNGRIVEVSPGVLRLEGGSHPTMVALARAPGLTGYPLAVIDASGRVGGAKATITHLASLGWTARIAPPTPSRQHSTIYYQAGDLEVAQGLARTLPIPVQLAACEQACRGVTLVVGADAVDHTGRG